MELFLKILSAAGSVLLAILILLVMITVHEFGHYLAGKALKFKINEFAIGFGPKLFKRTSKKTGEVFSVRALPLGGYCAFEGEDDGSEDRNSFNFKHPAKRIAVLFAGPFMNYLLALLLITVAMFAFGQSMFKINSVAPDESGAYAGYMFEEGDVILKAAGNGVYLTTDLMSAVSGKKTGDTVPFTVLRGGVQKEIEIKLRADCDFKNSTQVSGLWHALGVGTYPVTEGEGEEERVAYYYDLAAENCRFGFFETVGRSFVYSFRIAGTIFRVLGELLTGRLFIKAMGGPITTIKLTSELATQSVRSFLEIAAYIGVNLAVFNLLPIPALDGSKIVFCAIEWIFRKPVPRKIEAIIHAVGFVAILAFAVLVDILQFI